MTAGEFAFLALGLVLGVATGAALIEVLRARPPAARQVRVTVAPNAIQGRMSSTLSDPATTGDAVGPAARGPGDRRWRDELGPVGEPAAIGRRSDDPVADMGPGGTPVPSVPVSARAAPVTPDVAGPANRPDPLWLSPSSASRSDMVAVPMSLEPDPLTTALRATAAAGAVAAMAGLASREAASHPAGDASASGGEGGSASAGRAADRAPVGGPATADAGASSGLGSPEESGASGAHPADRVGSAGDDGPCADARRVADERCAVADRARTGAAAAADALRSAQRTYDGHVARAEAASAASDPRTVRTAKEQAQRRFHDARAAATTRDDVEAGARAWLAEINRINQETREAVVAAEQSRAAAAEVIHDLERLAVEADAARISAEQAEEACVAARDAVAACDEAALRDEAAAARGAGGGGEDRGAVSETEGDRSDGGGAGADEDHGPGRIAAATAEPDREFEPARPMASRAGQDPPILRILRGDRDAMLAAVARLAGDDPEARRRWQARLGGLAEALIARSIEASAFEFPLEHPFWGAFDQAQNRDIAAGLSSLGFRFDGFGGWVDDRIPSQRDLSLAVGYAGLDPMRIRHWPTEAETRELLREVRVAADEYVAGAAGGMTLGDLLTLLGRRADSLTELWNEWGAVRPVLLEAG